MQKVPPCRANCPGGADVRGWLAVINQRDALGLSKEEALKKAWTMIVERNPFPATMGRICPHPCEDGCNRTDKDGAVAINELERFVGDWAIQHRLRLPILEDTLQAEHVGVVGAGPAGLSFAYQMARRGYQVTVYEKRDESGGLLRYGIPKYRLPADVLDAEIDRITDLGVTILNGVRLGKEVDETVLYERHPILFLGIGASSGRKLDVPGESAACVMPGTQFLDLLSRGHRPNVGGRVVVVGGGNTAVDAARSARRLGAEVLIVYRRTRDEMPAFAAEVAEALQEGVEIEYLASPVGISHTQGEAVTIAMQRMELGSPDASGRRRPLPVSGSGFDVRASFVIVAAATEPDWTGIDALRPPGRWMSPAPDGQVVDGVWAGGDMSGIGFASIAISQGRLAAESAHAQARGLPAPQPPAPSDVSAADMNADHYRHLDRLSLNHEVALPTALDLDRELTGTITEDQFYAESSRCLSCGLCMGCQLCWMYCNAGCFTRVMQPEPGRYFALSLDACEACGKCVELCPCGFLTVRNEA